MEAGLDCKLPVKLPALFALGLMSLTGCEQTVEEHRAFVARGDLQIGVRTREWGHSGVKIIDACLMPKGSVSFPDRANNGQCFFHGEDIAELAVHWNLDDDVTISSRCGYVRFRNWALVDFGTDAKSVHRIHANFTDRCTTTHYQFVGLDEPEAGARQPSHANRLTPVGN